MEHHTIPTPVPQQVMQPVFPLYVWVNSGNFRQPFSSSSEPPKLAIWKGDKKWKGISKEKKKKGAKGQPYRGALPAQTGHVLTIRPPTQHSCLGSMSEERAVPERGNGYIFRDEICGAVVR